MTDTLMEQSMRWFGPADPVSLAHLRQAGSEAVVTALHEIPNGAVWPVAAIAERQRQIDAAGLRWSVVESLPVHEAIKRQAPGWDALVGNYRQSLANLAACGIRTVTYNFMPLLDWTRTDLAFERPGGARALRYEHVALAAFDLFILARPGAEADYPPALRDAAAHRFATMDEATRHRLERTIIAGLPGSEESFTAADFREAIAGYAAIGPDRLRANLRDFLAAVCPDAERLGMRLVIHPDDPPFPLFGLPRVVSTADDLDAIFAAVPSPANGLCFCVGSLGARADNDLPAMLRRFGPRIGFLHLRNVRREADRDFFEDDHLEGSSDMHAIVSAICTLSAAERRRIPMRPDHGHQMLDDLGKTTNPGYSAIGRLKGLAELRGLERGIVGARRAGAVA